MINNTTTAPEATNDNNFLLHKAYNNNISNDGSMLNGNGGPLATDGLHQQATRNHNIFFLIQKILMLVFFDFSHSANLNLFLNIKGQAILELESNSLLYTKLLDLVRKEFFIKRPLNWKPVKCELVINQKLTEEFLRKFFIS